MTRLVSYVRARAAAQMQIVRLLPAVGPRLLAFALALQVFAGVAPVAFIVATSAVVGRIPAAVEAGADSPEWTSLRNALLVAGVLFLVQQAAWPLQWVTEETIRWRVEDTIRDRLAAASFRPIGIATLEDEATLDQLGDIVDPVRGTGFSPGHAVAGFILLIARYVQWALAAAFVSAVTFWWVGIAAAAGALAVRIAVRSGVGRVGTTEAGFAPRRRRRDYFRGLLSGAFPAKELRVFGLLPWVQDRYRTQALDAVRPMWSARRRIVYVPYAIALPLATLLTGVATVAVARAAARGDLTLGELALALQGVVLIASLGSFFWESDWQTEHGMRAYGALQRFEQRAAAAGEVAPGQDPGDRPRSEITFERVQFAYPGGHRVFRELTLTIPAGRSLAIVGVNGAGKTTLAKLLARLYDPDGGRIAVDGIDIREFDARAWQRRVAAIFQDFVHYDLPVADNVAFGAPELLGDEARIARALERAGAADVVAALPNGTATVLSREYEGGAELSGGQWQRIAIARALMAVEGGAGVLVLDEPTANLDVRAEAAFFDRFLDLTRGLTTILISHRFSTVRRADRIVVLDQGVVVEEGTHAELLARGGRYAELFTLQAARFASGRLDDGDEDTG